MSNIKEIYIESSIGCLNKFSLDLENYDANKFNLFVIIGSNGSGKSTFLDTLYSIARTDVVAEIPTKFNIGFDDTENYWGNIDLNENKKEKLKNPWDMVIRYYTGNSKRVNNIEYEYIANTCMSFCRDDLKWVLAACFISGAWVNSDNAFIKDTLNSILFYKKNTFSPERIYIELKTKNSKLIEKLPDDVQIEEDGTKLSWKIKERNNFDISSILNTLLENKSIIDNIYFLYKKGGCPNLLPDETLSDGELGLIRRASLITYIKEFKNKKCLILLDEPETHFNENWKRHFIYLIKEALKDTYHDVFIATHSAMLITDVKRDELYHFELVGDKIKTFPVCLNTYATNIVDIGKALFDLEADIGEGSKHEIEAALKGVKEIKQDEKDEESISLKDQKEKLKELLEQVGPGEWRWKIRSKLNQIDKHENCPYLLNKDKEEKQ